MISLLFNILSRFVIAFFPRSKCLLISWLQSPSTVILELKKIKYVTAYTFSLSICHEMMGPDSMVLVYFESWGPNQVFHSFSSLTLIKRLFSSSLLSAIRVVSSAYLVVDISPGNLDSSLWFTLISLTFHMTYSAYKLNKQDDSLRKNCTLKI